MKNLLKIILFYLTFVNQSFTQNTIDKKGKIFHLDFNGGIPKKAFTDHPNINRPGLSICNNVLDEEFSALEINNSFSTLNTSAFLTSSLYLPEFSISFWFSPSEDLNLASSAAQKTILTNSLLYNPQGIIEIYYKSGKLFVKIKGADKQYTATNDISINFTKNKWYFLTINCKELAKTNITINEEIFDAAISNFKFAKFSPKILLGSSGDLETAQGFNGKIDDLIIFNYNLSREEIKKLYVRKGADYHVPYVNIETPSFDKFRDGPMYVNDPKFDLVICVNTGIPIKRFDLFNNKQLLANLPINKRNPRSVGCEYLSSGFINLLKGENKITIECENELGIFVNKRLTVIYEPLKNSVPSETNIVEIKAKEQPKDVEKESAKINTQKFNAEISLINPIVAKDGRKNINEEEIRIVGRIKPSDLVETVFINGKAADFSKPEGIFQLTIKLNNSENGVRIEAFDNYKNKIEYPFTIGKNIVETAAIPVAKKEAVAGSIKDIGKRFALVIGNDNYLNTTKLSNPINDAKLMATELKNLGFEVTKVENGSLKDISTNVIAFKNKLKDKDNKDATGLFYYAGHGIQDAKNRNYLIPVEAELKDEDALESEAYDLERLLNHFVDANNKLNIVILDACRNNPFARKFRGGETGGLAEVKISAEGLFIAYATAPGKTAADGDAGGNGLYTKEFVKELNKPNQTLEEVFKNTKANVYFESGKKQMPWETNFFIGDFWFNIK
jgi:Caspase domain/Concanavalin A-like lectin/glucanases superfamily